MNIVEILGTEYQLIKKRYEEEPYFKKRNINGYVDYYAKQIVYCDMKTYPGWEEEPETDCMDEQKQTLRHEIVHAFLDESGLSYSSLKTNDAWAQNEEMVDWFAMQGKKIHKAWIEADAI